MKRNNQKRYSTSKAKRAEIIPVEKQINSLDDLLMEKQINSLDDLLKVSPEEDGQRLAMYSVHCCWWTSFPEDLGKTPPVKVGKDGVVRQDPEGYSVPCCPHCGSVLLEAPLEKFIVQAKQHPEHFGHYGLNALLKAHSRFSTRCFRSWDAYNKMIREEREWWNPPALPASFA